MGTCFFRCIYFTIKSGLVQTHVHQITNMVLATASFPRNAYFCQTALFSKQLVHIFSCLPIGSISQISILQFLHSKELFSQSAAENTCSCPLLVKEDLKTTFTACTFNLSNGLQSTLTAAHICHFFQH